jgi:cytochrome c551/c552
MSKEKEPPEGQKPEDYREAAENSLELAKVLAGEGAMSDQDFLERMARSDALVDHDGETCGMCHQMILGAQVAREMLEAGEYEDVVAKWADEARRRWEESKFYKLWQEEEQAGRDPHQAFKERGWEP